MMAGCSVCGEIVIVLEDLTDEEVEHYMCPDCMEKD